MTTFGFRWYGPEDAVTLEHIRQIPPVTELVTSLYHIPAGALWPEEDIAARAAQSAAAGLHFSVAEGLPVHESIKLGGPERERYIGQFVENLERLARHGVHTVCYNFMPLFGWIRTELEQPLPDGSATLAFHQAALERMNPERDVWTLPGWNFSTRQGKSGRCWASTGPWERRGCGTTCAISYRLWPQRRSGWEYAWPSTRTTRLFRYLACPGWYPRWRICSA